MKRGEGRVSSCGVGKHRMRAGERAGWRQAETAVRSLPPRRAHALLPSSLPLLTISTSPSCRLKCSQPSRPPQPLSVCWRWMTAASPYTAADRPGWKTRPSSSCSMHRSNQRAGWAALACSTSQLDLGFAGKQPATNALGANAPLQPSTRQAYRGTANGKQNSVPTYSTDAGCCCCMSLSEQVGQEGCTSARQRSNNDLSSLARSARSAWKFSSSSTYARCWSSRVLSHCCCR